MFNTIPQGIFQIVLGGLVASGSGLLGADLERKDLGSRMRAWRLKQGLSQQAVAEILRKPQANLARWEAGKMTVPGELVQDIAEALGITMDQLFGPPPRITDDMLLRPGPKPRDDDKGDEGKRRKRE